MYTISMNIIEQSIEVIAIFAANCVCQGVQLLLVIFHKSLAGYIASYLTIVEVQ